MSTITKEFTKEQLQQIIETDHVQCGEASALARIALASLEAEPVAWAHRLINKRNGVVHPWVYGSAEACPSEVDIFNIEVMPLYTAQPAPVTPDGWISCSERMPNDAQWCVVNTKYGYYVQCWSEGQGWLGDDISIPECDVINWMPLPEPPQEVNRG